MSETVPLGVELAVDFTPGQPIRWAAFSTQPPHFAGEGSTPVGYGPSPTEALAALHAELTRRAKAAAGQGPEDPQATLTRIEEDR